MAITTQSIIGGSKISFKASSSSTPPASWESTDCVGDVESGNMTTELTEKELYGYAPDAPGVRAMLRKTPTSAKTTVSFTLSKVSQLHRDLMLGLDAQGNVGKGGYVKTGHLQVEVHDLENGLVETLELYGSLSADGEVPIAGEDFQLPKFKFSVYGGKVTVPTVTP